MLKLIHKIYRTDKVTIDIINALTSKLISSENKINDLYKQIFLNYATWYLDMKEKEMAITKCTDNITERRNIIKTRLLGVGTATKAMLEGTVNSVDGITIEVGFENMTVLITFIHAETNKLITFALDTLKEIIPYHLDLFFTYEHVKWQEVKNVTWGDVKKYTWKEIAESVEGTVEKGLSPNFEYRFYIIDTIFILIKTVDYAILNKEEVCTLQANRTYRDSVFTSYFSDKDKLIELYNAIEDTNYGNDTEVVINTLEDVLFMDRRNDISFTIDGKFVILIEHQTTVNQNMPLRCLMYVARLYEKIIDSKSVYKENLIKIPTPEFIVLYNGNKEQPEEHILKLSDAFIEKSDIKLELITKVININYGKSKILKKSKNLNEYSYFIYLIQKNLKNGQPLNEAIKNAVEECIKQGMMRDFLEKNSSEVINMLYTAFDIDVAKEVWQDEARQEGEQKGRLEGLREGEQKGRSEGLREGEQKGRSEGLREGEQKGRLEGLREIAKSLLDVLDIKVISQKTGLSVEEIEKLK